MKRIGIYSPARGLGSTLIAAHLHYYLREHGVRSCASSEGIHGERPPGLSRWQDIPKTPHEPVCLQTWRQVPLGLGVDVCDVHAELYADEHDCGRWLGELWCLEWVIPIRDRESLERGLEIARRTVAKYRESLRIPSSVERRRERALRAL